MGCAKLIKGLDLSCMEIFRKYYQSIVLVNRSDVESYNITSTTDFNRISFNLLPGKTGYLFRSNETADNLSATFSKKDVDNIPFYNHKVQVPVAGVEESIKNLLKNLDQSDVFAAIMFKNGIVEIYGFGYGLKTNDYTYEAQSSFGGAPVELQSREDEYDPPYIYRPFITGVKPSQEVLDQLSLAQGAEDFCNLFSDIDNVLRGDFNDDFNDDFNNE